MKKAFSLIELLVSVIIISLIAASFVPIVSKKLNNGKIGVSANKVKTNCPADKYGANCQACDNTKCLLRICKNVCAGNQYRDANCVCKNCADVYSKNCIACSETQCLAEQKDAACPEECKECDEYGKCIECQSSDFRLVDGMCKLPKVPANQADCDRLTNYNSIYIPNDLSDATAGGFCVHRKNAGDYGGPSVDSPFITTVGVASSISYACNTSLCCFMGGEGRYDIQQQCTSKTTANTSSTCGCSVLNDNGSCKEAKNCTSKSKSDDLAHIANVGEGTYGGCYRTVCNWDAAAYICQRYSVGLTNAGDWDIPTLDQLNAIKSAIDAGPATKDSTTYTIAIQKFSGANGLQLCAEGGTENTTGSPKCNARKNYCAMGSNKYDCRASYIWGGANGGSNCDATGACTTKSCEEYSGLCYIHCDTRPASAPDFPTSPYKTYNNASCSKTCPTAYPYLITRTKTCLRYGTTVANVSQMFLVGNNTNKTTDVTVQEISGDNGRKSTASVRCVLNGYVD